MAALSQRTLASSVVLSPCNERILRITKLNPRLAGGAIA
ncbi:hypothetical protein X566_20920 [Afipia sp. P52-10]|nr:hypothetical protein X566_20920 [Afipia sp. P52-10]